MVSRVITRLASDGVGVSGSQPSTRRPPMIGDSVSKGDLFHVIISSPLGNRCHHP